MTTTRMTNTFYTFLGQYMGAVTVEDGRWTLQPQEKLPCLSSLQGESFASEDALIARLASCFSAEEQDAMVHEAAQRREANARYDQECLRKAHERSYTGDRYDPARSLKDIVRMLKADIAEAEKTGALPALGYAVRSHKSRDIHIVTEAACLSKVKAALTALQRRYNRTVGDVEGQDEDAFWFQVESQGPFTNREGQQLKKLATCGALTREEFYARLKAATEARAAARADILRQYGEKWN